MRLNVVITSPSSADPTVEAGMRTLARLTAAVKLLEDAGVTAVVFTPGKRGSVSAFEPLTLAGALARATSSIGLVAADSALFGYPYNTARRLATLDHLAAGRAGWLVLPTTDPGEEAGFGLAVGGEGQRIGRASEFVEVVHALWDCWEPGAAVPDKATGDFQDDTRVHPIKHRSTYYQVDGPLDVPRCPQGRPVVFQAVGAPEELPLAARFAEVVAPWCATNSDVAAAVSRVRSAGEQTGRDPAELVVLPAARWRVGPDVMPIEEGKRMPEMLAELVHDTGADGITLVGDGTIDWVEGLAGEVLPALRGLLAPPRPGTTLAENYGLRRAGECDRSAA
jgi:alkanesulfonate monooxygenase SsuD/methylene tetrahydromethanopterin reductase-like flavin-dependent oxidoreductase (luciferase family)